MISFDSQGICEEGRAGLPFLPVRLKNGGSDPGTLASKEKGRGRTCAVFSQGMNGTEVEGSLKLESEGPGMSSGSFTY